MNNLQTVKLMTTIAKQIAQETITYYTNKKIKYWYNDYEGDETKRVTMYCMIDRVTYDMNDNRFTFAVHDCNNKKDRFWIGDNETFEVIE